MAKKKMPYDTAVGIVSDTYRAEVGASSDRDDLKSRIVSSQQAIRMAQDDEADDTQLTAARELARDLGKGYSERIKTAEAQIVVALTRLEELGDG